MVNFYFNKKVVILFMKMLLWNKGFDYGEIVEFNDQIKNLYIVKKKIKLIIYGSINFYFIVLESDRPNSHIYYFPKLIEKYGYNIKESIMNQPAISVYLKIKIDDFFDIYKKHNEKKYLSLLRFFIRNNTFYDRIFCFMRLKDAKNAYNEIVSYYLYNKLS